MENLVSKKKRIITLVVVLILVGLITPIGRIASNFVNLYVGTIIKCLIYVAIIVIALVGMKINGIKEDLNIKEPKQYLYGFLVAVGLFLIVGIIPSFFGVYLFGSKITFSIILFYKNLFFYTLFVGVGEEFLFRGFVQGTLLSLFGDRKCRWVAVIISSVIFGLWHIINGNLIQVLFTTLIGLVFGFAKYLIKDLKLPGLAVSHGLYDFLGYILTLFVG